MSQHSKFVLVSPNHFYVRTMTYMCASCGFTCRLEVETASEDLTKLEKTHVCHSEAPRANLTTFPLAKLLRNHDAKKL